MKGKLKISPYLPLSIITLPEITNLYVPANICIYSHTNEFCFVYKNGIILCTFSLVSHLRFLNLFDVNIHIKKCTNNKHIA